MTKEQLLISAKALHQPSKAAQEEYYESIDRISSALINVMSARADIERLIGPGNLLMMENNSRNFFRFMGAIFISPDPLVMVDTAIWAFCTYRSHGFSISYWPANLDTTIRILKEELSPETYKQVFPHFNWLLINIPAFTRISDSGCS